MKKAILLAMGVMLLWSCNNSAKTTSSEEAEAHTETSAKPNHHENSEAVELNNGEKWQVNEEMKPFVIRGGELVNDYMQGGKSDYKALAEQLKDQNNQLVKSCTMNGKSHDELHKWLHPHLELVKTLETETNAAKANETVLELQKSYQRYHQYFN